MRKLFYLILIGAFIWLFLIINNNWLQTTEYTIESEKVPPAFDDVKIVQLSDLHDATFGEGQSKLVQKVKKLQPDYIFLTGDLIDSNRYDLENSLELVKQLVDFSTVYYVTGNHEVAANKLDEIIAALESLGVKVLEDEADVVTRNQEQLVVAGINDPLMNGLEHPELTVAKEIETALQNVRQDHFILLLSHRPEVFSVYEEKGIDAAFTGHAHGGQFRIPGIGGLVSPGQGWFPAYSGGMYESGETRMIVSRGLGNSIIPFRIFNLPEIVVATLKSKPTSE